MDQSAPAIELFDVTKTFGKFVAVNDLTLCVERGEIFGLLGPNGSGKTTTVNLVSGLTRPTRGQVRVLGYDVTCDTRPVRAALGMVPQETALYEELTAGQNLEFHAELYDVPRSQRDERITKLLELVQLYDRRDSRAGTFSGGMKRRLALARALLHDPRLLYLDEPTLGVDVQSRRALWDYILLQRQAGKTVLITTNYLEEANVLCDRLAILDHGRLIALDTPAVLKQRFGDTVMEITLEAPPSSELLARLKAIPGVAKASVQGTSIHLSLNGETNATGDIVNLVASRHSIRAIAQREPNLDEVFLSLTGRALRD